MLFQNLAKTITQPLKVFLKEIFATLVKTPMWFIEVESLLLYHFHEPSFFLSWTPGEQVHTSNYFQGPTDLRESVNFTICYSLQFKVMIWTFHMFVRGQKQGYCRRISASGTNSVINNLEKLSGTLVTSHRAPNSPSFP